MLSKLLDFLFPPRCPGCERPASGLCPACLAEVRPVRPPPPEGLDEVRALGLYEGPLRQALIGLKLRGRLSCARSLAAWLDVPPGLLVPVPSPFWRHHRRGYNPAELLARGLGRPWRRLLACPGNPPQQKQLPLARRLEGRLFRAREAAPAEVVLVDDILTTGATLRACAAELRRAGAREVRAVVVAYQRRRNLGALAGGIEPAGAEHLLR